jgi:hypothetical protein
MIRLLGNHVDLMIRSLSAGLQDDLTLAKRGVLEIICTYFPLQSR